MCDTHPPLTIAKKDLFAQKRSLPTKKSSSGRFGLLWLRKSYSARECRNTIIRCLVRRHLFWRWTAAIQPHRPHRRSLFWLYPIPCSVIGMRHVNTFRRDLFWLRSPPDQKEKKLLPVKKTSSVSPIMPLERHIRAEAKRRSRAHSVPRRSLFSFYPTPCNVIAMGNVEVSRRSLFSFWSRQNRT